jgi:hypothetical protein
MMDEVQINKKVWF